MLIFHRGRVNNDVQTMETLFNSAIRYIVSHISSRK
jgi:hypothetical protein